MEIFNGKVNLLNELYKFREYKQMQNNCILDVIFEYCRKNDIDPEHLCAELSDYEGFQEIVELDLQRHKYCKAYDKSSLEEWNV